MKGLWKYLAPFAPDQSGAAAVFYDLGGMIVICDAGGCAGNICGFDEPRWMHRKSAVFSAGLRDMDAIMGRDAQLADKIADAACRIEVPFIVLIGTPVPAVIGTDMRALSGMIRTRTGLPVLSVDTNGMEPYDRGEEKAYLALYREFARASRPVLPGKILRIDEALGTQPAEEIFSLEKVRCASEAEHIIVSSPSGIAAARYLRETFGTPYTVSYPDAADLLPEADYHYAGKKVLIVHQHVLADCLRKVLCARGAKVTAATWFSFAEEIRRPEDISLKEEDDFTCLVRDGAFDLIIADRAMQPAAEGFGGAWIDAPHFAVSGRYGAWTYLPQRGEE